MISRGPRSTCVKITAAGSWLSGRSDATVERTSTVGYLPQDPRTGDLDTIARDRVLAARGIDQLLRDMEKAQIELGERPDDDALIRRYGRLEEQFTALGGYSAQAAAVRHDFQQLRSSVKSHDLAAINSEIGRHGAAYQFASVREWREFSDVLLED